MTAVTCNDVVVGFFANEASARLALAKHLDGTSVRRDWTEVERNVRGHVEYAVRPSSQEEFRLVLG